jgi:sarcosine oxidase subunit alpha
MAKTDFLGRRSLVRLAAGGPRQKLVGFTMAPTGLVPEEGLQIVQTGANGKSEIIGHVTSCRFSPTLNAVIGLCWLPVELATRSGAPFTIRLLNGSGLAEARVHQGPFYDPKGERLRM